MGSFGRIIFSFGIMLIIIGGIITLGSKFGLGRLPGDIFIRKGNTTFYFPILTSIIVSIILSVIVNVLFRK